MNLTRAFSFVFDDPDWWQFVLVLGLLQAVPLVGQLAALGSILLTARAVANGNEWPMPRLHQVGAVLGEGLNGALLCIIYYLPLFIIVCLASCCIVAALIITGNNAPPIVPLIALAFCLNILLMPLAFILQILLITGSGYYVATGTVESALQVNSVLAIFRQNPAEWLVLWLLSILCNVVAGIGLFGLGIGALFTTAYAALVFGHLLGQTVRQVSLRSRSL